MVTLKLDLQDLKLRLLRACCYKERRRFKVVRKQSSKPSIFSVNFTTRDSSSPEEFSSVWEHQRL